MEEDDSSSSGVESSPSEGEYVLPENQYTITTPPVPQFDFTGWSPESTSGLSFISLVPIGVHGYDLGDSQQDHVGKVKATTSHKRIRRREYSKGRSMGHFHDERKLRQAVSDDDIVTAQTLLESGVDPCTSDDKERSPLHFAAAKGNAQMVGLLLDGGADPNQKDTIGNTPLHLAACTSQVRVVTLLLRAGTDVHAIDNTGRTPLHIARSRLRMLHENRLFTSDQLKVEVSQVVDMMREYLNLSGFNDDVDQLSMLCERLEKTSTREEVDEISGLLQDFTNLSLQKKETEPD